MIDRLKGVIFAIVRRLLLSMTKPQTRGVDALPSDAPMVYVLANRSLTDLAMLDIATDVHALPRPRTSLAPHGVPERQRYFFLARGTGGLFQRNLMRSYPRRLQRLQTYFRYTRRADLFLVPVSVFWSRAPSKERSLIRVMLSEDWTLTSRFRRLVVILFNRRDITVQFGTAMRLSEIDDGTLSEAKLARRIARRLRVSFKNQRTALLGPDLSHRRTLVTQITRSRNVREAIRAEAERTRTDVARVTRRARKQAFEIASDVSYITIRFFDRVLTWFWNRIYDGMVVNGIEAPKKLAETSTLVYVPCHRSHVDYLVLSYVLYYEGLMIPHIAAGENLNMPVIGGLLRRGGAFFMRRRFADDRLYSAVFNEYLYQVFQRGSPVEYFIEGGRSRTGRPLAPRTGLLNMTIASHAREIRRPIVFVPVYIGYEKLIEARSYLDELKGSEKRRESIADIVRTLKVIRERFGRVHVNFGEPLPLAEFLARPRPADPNPARELGMEILQRINACADVNPVNLVALVLLFAPKLAMDEQLLAEQLDCFAALLRTEAAGSPAEAAGSPAEAAGSPAEAAGSRADAAQTRITVTAMTGTEMIAHAEALGMLVREQHPFGDVLCLDGVGAVLMTWYRNNVIHTLALPSLIACLMINRRRPVARAALVRMVETVYPYLAAELFVESDGTLADRVEHWLARLIDQGLLRTHAQGHVSAPSPETNVKYRLEFLASVVMQILERFFIAIALLERIGQRRMDRPTLEQHCQDVARRMSRLHGLNAPEFFDPRLFHGFLDTLIDRGAVTVDATGLLTYQSVVSEVIRAAGAVLPTAFRDAVLRAGVHIAGDDGASDPVIAAQ